MVVCFFFIIFKQIKDVTVTINDLLELHSKDVYFIAKTT